MLVCSKPLLVLSYKTYKKLFIFQYANIFVLCEKFYNILVTYLFHLLSYNENSLAFRGHHGASSKATVLPVLWFHSVTHSCPLKQRNPSLKFPSPLHWWSSGQLGRNQQVGTSPFWGRFFRFIFHAVLGNDLVHLCDQKNNFSKNCFV